MHDTLAYVAREPIHRQYHHNEMTFSTVYAWSENYVLPISHDEVVHGKRSLTAKMPGDQWRRLANTRALLAFMWAHPGKQLLFMGCELGDEEEWSESRGLNWGLLHHGDRAGVQKLVRDLNTVYRRTAALWTQDTTPAGFRWINSQDAGSNAFSFLRLAPDGSAVACLINMSGGPQEHYRVGLPRAGTWREIVNTDALSYGGSGVGNMGEVRTEEVPWDGLPLSASLRLPPLGALWLQSP
jgi:1,4-alpha-glucan branching enzyme